VRCGRAGANLQVGPAHPENRDTVRPLTIGHPRDHLARVCARMCVCVCVCTTRTPAARAAALPLTRLSLPSTCVCAQQAAMRVFRGGFSHKLVQASLLSCCLLLRHVTCSPSARDSNLRSNSLTRFGLITARVSDAIRANGAEIGIRTGG